MINVLFSRLCILAFGTLYPGYISFKTVRAKIVEDYVTWMMYWIVFALYTATECLTDIFLTWFPFYYEAKVVILLWLLPTMGNGSSFVYKQCIHPLLKKHETRVDQHLEQVREQGQAMVLHYIKEACMFITKSVMDVINRNFPNSTLGLLANTTISSGNAARRLPEFNNIIVEEIQEQEAIQATVSKTKNRKPSGRTLPKATDAGDAPQASRGRPRRGRHSKSEIELSEN